MHTQMNARSENSKNNNVAMISEVNTAEKDIH